MFHVLEQIADNFKSCWLPHSYVTKFDDGNYKYKECTRCNMRKVEITHLQHKLPDYGWVRHEKDEF